MERPIAVIAAMDEELAELTKALDDQVCPPRGLSDLPILTGTLGEVPVVLARSGIGKVNAALVTQYIIDRFAPALLLNTGVAGGLSPDVQIGDLILGQSSLQHDLDARHFGYALGVIPRLATSTFPADSRLLELAAELGAAEFGRGRLHRGLIVSGDEFVGTQQRKTEILRDFPQALCVEMEGAAIAQVAYLNRLPHLILRAISDLADSTAPENFEAYLVEVIPSLARVVKGLIIRFAQQPGPA